MNSSDPTDVGRVPPEPGSVAGILWPFHVVAFISAFLMFQVQLITSKLLLPEFGGSYLVWGSSMIFYQVALVFGYLYAHTVQRWLGVRRYARWHWGLLVLGLLACPFCFTRFPWAQELPLGPAVFVILASAVGLPVWVLASTSLVLQRWVHLSGRGHVNPYVLYAASNLGSMLGLISYPFLVEPFLTVSRQAQLWWWAYGVMAILHGLCMPRGRGDACEDPSGETSEPSPVKPRSIMGWFLPSAAACALLLSVTNVLTFDVASVPLLWVLPLAVYLLAFVLAFKRVSWNPVWMERLTPWAVMLGLLLYLMAQVHLALPVFLSLVLHVGILFVICLNCTCRLVSRRPADERHLTLFYVMISVGGLVGSLVVAWVIPLVSSGLVEYPLSFVVALLALGTFAGGETPVDRRTILRRRFELVMWVELALVVLTVLPMKADEWLPDTTWKTSLVMILIAVPVALALLGTSRRPGHFLVVVLAVTVGVSWTEELGMHASKVRRLRNYYGIYKIFDRGPLRILQHGTTLHGRQYLVGPEKDTPIAYYHPTSPVAEVMQTCPVTISKVAMIGLGSGALAAYAQAGWDFTIYELDPDNLPIALNEFTYLDIAARRGANLKFVFGDGRVMLRKAKTGALDVLVIDAFNSGSIPTHLLTVEAFREYLRVVRPGGLVLLHVSNRVLNLHPVVYSNARSAGWIALEKTNAGKKHPDAESSDWMALTGSRETATTLERDLGWRKGDAGRSLPRPWTDQYTDIFPAILAD